jgi:diaminopropionate ammonia-lyase
MTLSLPHELAASPLWTHANATALIELPALAAMARVGRVWIKAEGQRPLGNFKVLGGMLAGLRAIARAQLAQPGALPKLLCASDGNHGLAVAAAAQAAGTGAAIFLPVGVSATRSQRILAMGADVVWVSGTYDDAVGEAAAAAKHGEGLLIADTTADLDDPVVHDVMAGYSIIAEEMTQQFAAWGVRPSHHFVQAGVGGLAAAMANGLVPAMRAPHGIVVVEPDTAPCVAQALAAGRPVQVAGALLTTAEMLSCGVASAPAVVALRRHQARSVLVNDQQLQEAVQHLLQMGGASDHAIGRRWRGWFVGGGGL